MKEKEYHRLLRSIRFAIASMADDNIDARYIAHCLSEDMANDLVRWERLMKHVKKYGVPEISVDLDFPSQQKKVIYNAISRSKKFKTPTTLTLDEWLETLEYFGHVCAYCRERPYQVLEHFVPIDKGGGTSRDNCVPACYKCNIKKGGNHPDELSEQFSSIEMVRSYLNQFS